MSSRHAKTVWVLGDQLNRNLAHLRSAQADETRVLFVVSLSKLRSAPWHQQRLHFILTAMRRFALELIEEGFSVDWRVAETMTVGLQAHIDEFSPKELSVMQPMNRSGQDLIDSLAKRFHLTLISSDQFLCSREQFAEWAAANTRKDGSLLMEDFYRWQRRRMDILIDAGGEPVGGRWNYDEENRLPPPKGKHEWPEVLRREPDEVDAWVTEFLNSVDGLQMKGDAPTGLWATDHDEASRQLEHFLQSAIANFGPYEDAIVGDEPYLNHSLLSPYLNYGLLHPSEVVAAVQALGDDIPLNSTEGFIRQVIGWREYVHGLYWWFGPDYVSENHFNDDAPVPPAFSGGTTEMNCVAHVAKWVEQDAWTHHIPRLMVLANLATLAGIDPSKMMRWMWASFIDGAEWVMAPNVIGMGMYADGGRMSTKPYVSGGNYISKMTDFCGGCSFDRKARTGDTACPFTTLYWDFLDRNRDALQSNHRMARVYANLNRLADIDEVRERAVEVRTRLIAGTI
jgi:deoxyribodipyrimidine photolyase-related protein